MAPAGLLACTLVVASVDAQAAPQAEGEAAQAKDGSARTEDKTAPAEGRAEQVEANEPNEGTPAPSTGSSGPERTSSLARKSNASIEPRLHHAPQSVAAAHEALRIRADIEHPEMVKRAVLVFRNGESPRYREVTFRRGDAGPYVAVIPKEHVVWPHLSYAIEIEHVDGNRRRSFATRARPHRVLVPEDLMDLRERALSQRLNGRRSVFSASADYVSFGESVADAEDPATGQVRQEIVDDRYFRLEGAYTYRPLRWVTEFSVRAGIVRGKAPVQLREPLPGQTEDQRFDVGLNYGAPAIRFFIHDAVHVDAEVLSSVTEVGFSWGGGGAVLLGDPYGSKLTLGFETIQTFGTRLFARMDVVATPRVRFAPIIEITNMPSAERFGVRLLGEVRASVGGGLSVAGRGGYQARVATSGGAAFGTTLDYAF